MFLPVLMIVVMFLVSHQASTKEWTDADLLAEARRVAHFWGMKGEPTREFSARITTYAYRQMHGMIDALPTVGETFVYRVWGNLEDVRLYGGDGNYGPFVALEIGIDAASGMPTTSVGYLDESHIRDIEVARRATPVNLGPFPTMLPTADAADEGSEE
ncbi:MAG: hypothetical protein IPM16_19530 [Chloroflexi bacterium]|nr:hypothetical protein [Chloroflexota bacterium]